MPRCIGRVIVSVMGETLYPLKFREIFKERPWAWDRLRSVCGKNIPAGARIGESWEVADLGEDVSVVKEGALAGTSLRVLAERYPDRVIGTGRHSGRLPLLFKLIASGEALSIQVHPDDSYAAKQLPGACGKMEAWHILHAEPDAWIVLGLNRLTDRIELEALLAAGEVEKLLHRIPVKAGQTYLVRPGIVHAVGPGIVLAEIQQSSDITYRLYDWGRNGLDGKPRELHLGDALNVVKCREPKQTRCEPKEISAGGALHWQKLVECDMFVFERIVVDGDEALLPPRECFEILYVVEGAGVLKQPSSLFRKRPVVRVQKGESVLLPLLPDGVFVVPEGRMVLLLADPGPALGGRR